MSIVPKQWLDAIEEEDDAREARLQALAERLLSPETPEGATVRIPSV